MTTDCMLINFCHAKTSTCIADRRLTLNFLKLAEGVDFITLPTEHRSLEFTISEDTQRRCTFYEILEDSEIEGDEYFTVRLSSNNRQVIVTNEATVTIVDGDDSDVEATSTTEPAISTTVSTTTTSVPTSIIPTGKFHLSSTYYSLKALLHVGRHAGIYS